MGEVKLQCPHCEEVISVDVALLGTTIPCPQCSDPVSLPKPKAPVKAPREASFIQEEMSPALPEEEEEIFETGPRVLGYLGRILWSVLWIVFGFLAYRYLAGLTSLADIQFLGSFAAELKQFELTPNAAYLGLIFSLFGVLGLLRVVIETMFNRYRLTTQRLFLRAGFIARHTEEIELFRIKDVSVRQGILHRLVGAGNVTVQSSDDSTPYVVLRGIPRPQERKEQVRKACREARRREGMRAAEFIQS